jgi:hypothetical protein
VVSSRPRLSACSMIRRPTPAEQAVAAAAAGLSVILAVSAAAGSVFLSMIFCAVSGGGWTCDVRLTGAESVLPAWTVAHESTILTAWMR